MRVLVFWGWRDSSQPSRMTFLNLSRTGVGNEKPRPQLILDARLILDAFPRNVVTKLFYNPNGTMSDFDSAASTPAPSGYRSTKRRRVFNDSEASTHRATAPLTSLLSVAHAGLRISRRGEDQEPVEEPIRRMSVLMNSITLTMTEVEVARAAKKRPDRPGLETLLQYLYGNH